MNYAMLDSFMEALTGPCKVREGESLLACCSGGIDSMVLLDLILQASKHLHLRVGVVHVDHGIRKEASWRDALFVSEHCARLGLICHVHQLHLSAGTPNLEEKARLARYEAIFTCMGRHGFGAAATGHTLDDQAETILYRLIRGSGIRGLAGMEHRTADGLVRPLLGFSRRQVEDYAARRGISHVEDGTNSDPAFARNLIRHEIVPVMQKLNPSVLPSVARLAEIAREEGGFIEELSRDLEQSACLVDWGTVRSYRLSDLASAPRPVLKRMVIRVLSSLLNEPRGIDAVQVEAVVGVVSGRSRSHTVRRRVSARADGEVFTFCPAGPGPFYDVDVTGTGVYTIAPLSRNVRILINGEPGPGLRLRPHTSGERFQGKRVVKILAERGIMKPLRPFWPVLASGEVVVSIAGILDAQGGMGLKTEFPCGGRDLVTGPAS